MSLQQHEELPESKSSARFPLPKENSVTIATEVCGRFQKNTKLRLALNKLAGLH